MATKRKRSGLSAMSAVSDAGAEASNAATAPSRPRQRSAVPLPANVARARARADPSSSRRTLSRTGNSVVTDPDANPDVLDGPSALRASPDCNDAPDVGSAGVARKSRRANARALETSANGGPSTDKATSAQGDATTEVDSLSSTSAEGHGPVSETAAADLPDQQPGRNKRKKGPQHMKLDSAGIDSPVTSAAARNGIAPPGTATEKAVGVTVDPEGNEDLDENECGDEVTEALSRPPPVNSDYLPLPWKGRLGYACLNTYLREAKPPVFSSRTCRIASILEHRHPLKDPSQPEHATKNRPDKNQPADIARGQRYVQELGLANARDVSKMLRWNDKYGIRFMRLSSEMFPFASHDEYGYKLAPFAADTLAEVGKVVAELGHRVTTHPGQFTQLGSPRKQVIDNAMRDLEYHAEMLSLLRLPPQQNRDAVMILHLGGAYGDKPAAIDRFRENYARLPQGVKDRLVLENDDVVWSVHEILPLCQELNIPMVLDFHHHNILFDATQVREGTKDVVDMFPTILETWNRKNITPKMHYSEPCPDAITGRSRRKHSPRVMTLPPCPDTTDLMIEAKDKEQAVFELMHTFKLPGFHTFSDITPHVRPDENKPFKPKPKKVTKKGKKTKSDNLDDIDLKIEEAEEDEQPPPLIPEEEVGMGGPEGRVYWPPGMEDWLRPPKRIVKKKEEGTATPAKKKPKTLANDDAVSLNGSVNGGDVKTPAKKAAPKRAAAGSAKKKAAKAVPTPLPTDDEDGDSSALSDLGDEEEEVVVAPKKRGAAATAPLARKRSGRAPQKVSYKEEEVDEMSV